MSQRGEQSINPPIVDMENADNNGGGCISNTICNPKHGSYRFMALVFMCLMGFGSYFCYDNPGALQDNMKDDLKLTTTQFVMFYSVYSWPNVIMCFIGGFLIDRVFGIRFGTVLYMTILMIGVTLFALGGYMNAYKLMIVGRFIFGVGGEALAVAQNNYAVRWFKGKELNMVFGLQLSFARVGSTVNFLVMEPLYVWVSQTHSGPERIGIVLFMASLTCVFSFISILILTCLDSRADAELSRNSNRNHDEEPVRLSDIKYFKCTFWLVALICVTYYVAVFPFIALGKVFFERKYDMSPQDANTVNSLLYILSAVASPLLGFLIDKTGRNLYWMVTSILMTIGAHGILTFTYWNPYVGMMFFGLSYSTLASSLWPLVSLIIPDRQLGTAYGICQAVQNIGMAIVSLVTGLIVDNGGYFMLELFFLGCLFATLIAAVCMVLLDAADDGILNMTPQERNKLHARSNDDDTVRILPSEPEADYSINTSSVPISSDSNRIRTRYLTKIGTNSSLDNMH